MGVIDKLKKDWSKFINKIKEAIHTITEFLNYSDNDSVMVASTGPSYSGGIDMMKELELCCTAPTVPEKQIFKEEAHSPSNQPAILNNNNNNNTHTTKPLPSQPKKPTPFIERIEREDR